MAQPVKQPKVSELIAFCAILIATVALSVDIMLPGLSEIAPEWLLPSSVAILSMAA